MTKRDVQTKSSSRKKNPTQDFPTGWDAERVRKLAEHYDQQSEKEQVAEHEAAFDAADQTMMGVPTDLVPEVRKLIVQHRRGA